ncbi:hypothetical protein Tco_0117524, partial [Tanacetum coccineum]
ADDAIQVSAIGLTYYCTLDNEEMEITATIDRKVKSVSKASIKRHLKLEDSNGISNLPTTEIFEQLALMGYGLILQGEGSTVPVESHHTPTSAPSTLQPPISSPSRRTTRQESMVPQPISPTKTPVADEAASTCVDVRHGGAATTVTSLDVGQGSGNIDKTPSMPHDSPVPRVNTLGSDEGSMTLQELMILCTTLSKKVESLEEYLKQTKQVYGAAYTKLIRIVKRKIDEINQYPDISLVQHDKEVQGRHYHDMESDFEFTAAEKVYIVDLGISIAKPISTTGAAVTTASVIISTASTTSPPRVSTADDISTTETLVYIRRSETNDKEQLDEEERQRIARVHEEASSFNIEEWEAIQARVEADEELAHRTNTFTLMESDVPKIAAESSKRPAEEELDQDSSKRQKTSESSELVEELRDKEEPNELSQ